MYELHRHVVLSGMHMFQYFRTCMETLLLHFLSTLFLNKVAGLQQISRVAIVTLVLSLLVGIGMDRVH